MEELSKTLESPDKSDLKNSSRSRRSFVKKILGAAAVFSAVPYIKCSQTASPDSLDLLNEEVNRLSAGMSGDEQFWNVVKDQFIIDRKYVHINASNLAPAPRQVMETHYKFIRDVNVNPSSYNRSKYGEMRRNTRMLLADFIGAGQNEIAIVRNTSEANNIAINGLQLSEGDEVVIWDQNHTTLNTAWDVRAEMYGFKVIRVGTPVHPDTPDDLIKPFKEAITSRTKVIGFSDTSNISGVRLPAKELCTIARNAGILTVVDGVQTVGARRINVKEMGCDFYNFSSHKWMVGPHETGVMYIREELISDLKPLIVGVGWAGALESGTAQKFEKLGQQDNARIAAFGKAVEFHNTIGKERIENRVKALAAVLEREVLDKIPGAEFYSPVNPELSCGVVKFNIPGKDLSGAQKVLYEKHNIICTVHGGNLPGIRFSPHLYTTMEDLKIAVKAVSGLA